MEDLALVYDDEFGPDYVIGIMAGEFPALDQNEAAFEKALRMFKEAARRGEEDYPLNFLAKRFAELMSKVAAGLTMKITKSQLQQVIREAVQEEIRSGDARADREFYLEDMGRSAEYLEEPIRKNFKLCFIGLKMIFCPYDIREEVEIGEAAKELYKLLKARVEGPDQG